MDQQTSPAPVNLDDRPSLQRPSHDEIAEMARQIFEEQGSLPGRDDENWLEAERRLMEVRSKAAAHPADQRDQIAFD